MNIQKLLRVVLLVGPVLGLLSVLGSYFTLGATAAQITFVGVIALAAGFFLTATIVAALTGAWQLKPWQMVMAFMGKMGWWLAMFLGAKLLPKGSELALLWAMGAYVFVFFAASLWPTPKGGPKDAPHKQ